MNTARVVSANGTRDFRLQMRDGAGNVIAQTVIVSPVNLTGARCTVNDLGHFVLLADSTLYRLEATK